MIRSVSKNNLNSKKDFFIKSIAKFCDKCGNPYSEKDLEIIQDTNISSIIHFSCSNCKSSNIATYIKPMGISNRMPINTDLKIEEISRFASMNETSAEEILELYTYLKKDSKVLV
jgi:hypothetical protein